MLHHLVANCKYHFGPFTCYTSDTGCFCDFFFGFVFQRSLHPLPFVHGIRLDLIPSESSKSWPTRRWRLARSLERKTKFIKTLTSKKERVWYSTRASRSWENIMSHFSLKWPSYTAEKMHCSWIPPPVMPPAFYEAVNQCEKEKEERKKSNNWQVVLKVITVSESCQICSLNKFSWVCTWLSKKMNCIRQMFKKKKSHFKLGHLPSLPARIG